MLYQLSYASKFGGKTRYRANLSLRSLPDVRDNYLRYHKGKLGCNRGLGRCDPTIRLAHLPRKIPRPAGESAGLRDNAERWLRVAFSLFLP